MGDDVLAGAIGRLRVGTGIDAHAFGDGVPLVLGGVDIPHDRGLVGHSDADLVAHAVTDALLGAGGHADIGTYFPSDDEELAGADSMQLLAQVVERVCGVERGQVLSLDVVVALQAPRLSPYRDAIRQNLAETIGVDVDRVTVRATTTDHLGFIGRREGALATATCLMLRAGDVQPGEGAVR